MDENGSPTKDEEAGMRTEIYLEVGKRGWGRGES